MVKFSVTIPAYKRQYLDIAIRSVACQTCKDWELVVVDDCSPEDIHSVVEPFLQDERVHYYRNAKNCGAVDVVDNWNICLNHCVGDYVVCIGDDDRLLPNCLSEYSAMIDKHPGLNVYHGRTRIIDENGQEVKLTPERPETETLAEMLLRQWTEDRIQFLGDFLFSRSWLQQNHGYVKFPLAYSSDWATANLAAKDGGIANVNATVFEYRVNRQSISITQNLRLTVTACGMASDWYSSLLKPMGKTSETACLHRAKQCFFTTKLQDLIYQDCRRDHSLRNLADWITAKTQLSKLRVLIVCIRAVLSTLRNGKP